MATVQWLARPADYATVWQAMREFTETRTPATPDTVWLVEHAPVYTLGQAGKPEHVLDAGRIPVVHTDRGGQVTYHGPGQVVAYALVDLRRAGLFVKDYVDRLEQAAIDTLAGFGLAGARRRAGAPGVYVPAAAWKGKAGEASSGPLPGDAADLKIAALGIKVRNGRAYHGLALNVDMDLSPFDGINPCGYAGLRAADMAGCGVSAGLVEAGERLASNLLRLAGLDAAANAAVRNESNVSHA